eukprot:5495392-Alexandrium_andersonii.AAC.1
MSVRHAIVDGRLARPARAHCSRVSSRMRRRVGAGAFRILRASSVGRRRAPVAVFINMSCVDIQSTLGS